MSDPLDFLLREDARAAIPDDGFTGRVLDALPQRRFRRERTWLTPLLVLGSAALGSALAVILSPAQGSLYQGFVDLMELRAFTPAGIASLAIGLTLLVSAVLVADSD